MKFFASNEKSQIKVALHYASMNLPVFPVSYTIVGMKGENYPVSQLTKATATTDPEAIKAEWEAHPNSLVAIPTGKKSGLIVLRVSREGRKALEEWKESGIMGAEEMACQETPDYLEYIFKAPESQTIFSAEIEEGIKVLGEKESFAVAPGICKMNLSGGQNVNIEYVVKADAEPIGIPKGLLNIILRSKAGKDSSAELKAVAERLAAKADKAPKSSVANIAGKLRGGSLHENGTDTGQEFEEAYAAATGQTTASTEEPEEGLPKLPLGALPESVAKIVSEAARALNTDEWLPFAALLQTTSTIVGANVMLQHVWKSPGFIWLCLIGRPSMGKSTAMRLFGKILRDTEEILNEQYMQESEQYLEDIEEWKQDRAAAKKQKESFTKNKPLPPLEKSLYVNDATIEVLKAILADNPGGLSWINDELDSLFSSFDRYTGGKGGTTKSDLLSMYTGEPLKVSRRNREARAFIPEAWVGVFGTTQYGKLANIFKKDDRDTGFMQRFIFICAEKKAPIPYHMRETTESLEGEIYDFFKVMLNGVDRLTKVRQGERAEGKNTEPRLIKFLDDKAKSLFENYMYRMEAEAHALSGGEESGDKESREKRWCDQFPRLLLLLHAIESAAVGKKILDYIPHETVEKATQIFQAMKGHSEYAWSLAKGKTRLDALPVELIKILDKYIEKGREYVLHYARVTETGEKVADAILDEICTVTKSDKTKRALSKSLESMGFSKGRTTEGTKYTIAPSKYQKLLDKVNQSQDPAEIEPVCPPAPRKKESIVEAEMDHFLLTMSE